MKLRCIECGLTYAPEDVRTSCDCGGLLEVDLTIPAVTRDLFDNRLGAVDHPLRSGVWRFRELMPDFPDDVIVSKPEGNTNLYHDQRLSNFAGTDVWFKHEGENPTGSFKDRGMTVGISHARWTGATMVACASTGNTSAAVASYAAAAGIPSVVFIPEGKISAAKLGQTIAYGTTIIQVRGDFDAAMQMVREATSRYGIYLLNSLNPFRLEGQKSIVLEALQQLHWQMPDWIVVPGGNLGNTSALGKSLREALAAGLIDAMPRIAVVQAAGAAPFYRAWQTGFADYEPISASTVASAIQIGNPVNYTKARRVVLDTEGTVTAVDDDAILAAKAMVDRVGIGCEPASAAGLAGIRRLIAEGVIQSGERVLTYLTGNLLKDTEASADYYITNAGAQPVVIDPTLEALGRALATIL
ncbi:MAG: threonine synthase [Thermomicrobiales bacterium]|nr:threonine synthase [Thermomicrobiales bacterium]